MMILSADKLSALQLARGKRGMLFGCWLTSTQDEREQNVNKFPLALTGFRV